VKRLQVDSVERFPLPENELHGFQLEVPRAGEEWSSQTLHFDGWVLGKEHPVVAVEVLQDGRTIARIPVRKPRADVGERFPDLAGAETSGFAGALGALRLRRTFELLLRGELASGVTMPLATVAGKREPVQLPPDGRTTLAAGDALVVHTPAARLATLANAARGGGAV